MEHQDLSFYASSQYRTVLSLVIGLFLYLFLVAFLPFGVSNHDPDHHYSLTFLLQIAVFGVVATASSLVNEFAIRPVILRQVTPTGVILWSAWTCLFISQVMFVTYNFVGNWHDWHFSSAVEFLINVSMVLLFPLVGTWFYFRHRGLRHTLQRLLRRIDEEVDPEQLITFEGKGANERFVIRLADFLYARSQDNYVELHYLQQGSNTKSLIRATLSGLAEGIGSPAIARCHRSYLVNLYQVRAIDGGDRDLRLQLKHVETSLPVSRTFRTDTLGALEQVKSFA